MVIYIIFFIGVLYYGINKDMIDYKEGKYNPYMFRKPEYNDLSFGKRFLIIFLLIIGPNVFFSDDQLYIVSIMFLATIPILIFCPTILNYLSYTKNKDKKIIIQNVIYILLLVVMAILLWNKIIWFLFPS